MKSLNGMYAEFGRKEGSRDKTKRKKKSSLLGSVAKGALIGGATATALTAGAGALAGAIGGYDVKSKLKGAAVLGTAAPILGMRSGILPAAALAGGAGAAGSYAINKIRGQDQEPAKAPGLLSVIKKKVSPGQLVTVKR